MNEMTGYAITAVNKARYAFCKFISANDVGATGAHQAGFYIPKNCWPLMFDAPGIKGTNKDRFIKIRWQNDFETVSRFIYYGSGTRNEYRLTRLGKNFLFFQEDNVGDLIIIYQIDSDDYSGFILSADEDIEDFLASFSISPDQTNRLIEKRNFYEPEVQIKVLFYDFINQHFDFPSTSTMSDGARECVIRSYGLSDEMINKEADKWLLQWIDAEYKLFKAFETKFYGDRLRTPFESMDELIAFSNTLLNRRKSRAGKSLEHHLARIFTCADLRFEAQVVTEDNKKPDFIFPGGREYHDKSFPKDKLVCLGAKTTCKDRWRQVLNEADNVPVKHLFTLQQGISRNQLSEMYHENVCLVVPAQYLNSFDKEFQSRIMTLSGFTSFVKEKQN